MSRTFFDTTPSDWQELELLVEQAFAEMGYTSRRAYKLKTVRGEVVIDVYAEKITTPIPTVVLCECKHWNKAVPQNIVHGFRTVCSDSGAHFGLIISKKGFQSGAAKTRVSTNVHLMNFAEFQETFFDEWKAGALVMLSMMRGQLLPIFRASSGMQENGLDMIAQEAICGIDAFNKYSIFFGYDGGYSQYFILGRTFPTLIPDPRGDPRKIRRITVSTHREYLEIAREALIENTERFKLPELYYSQSGQQLMIPNKDTQDTG